MDTAPLPMTRTAATATDLMVGVAAGLTAALAMNLFQAGWVRLAAPPSKAKSATETAADALSRSVTGRNAKPAGRKALANAIHYATGAMLGGVYGVGSGIVPVLSWGQGTAFGAAVWAAGDEIVVPALGLAPPAGKTAAGLHAFGLASHLVFGVTLEVVRRQLNALISARRAP